MARYNIAPGQMVPVIIANNLHRIVLMRWGLIPHWAKDAKTAYKMINARVETLTQRPAFRGLLSHHRCLVPACGYYEWQGEGRDKTPYYIHPHDQQYIAFAGLYDVWTKPEGDELYTFTIITTEADPCMARLHNRMPVMLARELGDAWLDPALTQAQDVLDLLSRSTGLELDAYPVSRLVNTPSHDSPALIQRVE
jgi:putative SOS response-associated peptidase YedK